MKLSVVIPAYNEEGSIQETLTSLYSALSAAEVDHEIVVVNDNSKDKTLEILQELQKEIPTLVCFTNPGPNGFGYAIRYGLDRFTGECVGVMMSDLSDDPADLIDLPADGTRQFRLRVWISLYERFSGLRLSQT